MPKLVLLLFAGLLVVPGLEAQDQFKPSTYFGISAGYNLSRVSFTPTVSQTLLTAASAGLVFRQISEPHIGLQLEIGYAGKGWIEKRDSIGTYKRTLQVINAPMQAVFIAGSRTVRLAVTLGPYISWLRHEKEIISVADTGNYKPYYLKALKGKWEFGFTGGLGVEIHTKIGAFGLRAVYNHSLTNLFPLNASEFYFNGSRSQVLQAGLTYLIKL